TGGAGGALRGRAVRTGALRRERAAAVPVAPDRRTRVARARPPDAVAAGGARRSRGADRDGGVAGRPATRRPAQLRARAASELLLCLRQRAWRPGAALRGRLRGPGRARLARRRARGRGARLRVLTRRQVPRLPCG